MNTTQIIEKIKKRTHFLDDRQKQKIADATNHADLIEENDREGIVFNQKGDAVSYTIDIYEFENMWDGRNYVIELINGNVAKLTMEFYDDAGFEMMSPLIIFDVSDDIKSAIIGGSA